MPRALIDSEYIFGIHEPGGEPHMLAAGRPGWILFTEAIGHDPNDYSGVDYTAYSSRGLGILCRLNHGYEPDGTLPHSSLYEPFARRVANFVSTSRGCKIWVLGNEMNYAVERPGIHIDWSRHSAPRSGPPEQADPLRRGLAVRFNVLPDYSTEIRTTRGAIIGPGESITPEMYARCYRLCRDAIHRLPGHEQDQVLVGAVAPWNTQTIYPGNPNGDWVHYFRDILAELAPDKCDGFALHTFSQGDDPERLGEELRLGPPFQNRYADFRSFMDFLAAVPEAMRHLPAYITETGQLAPWPERNSGWVQRAYAEVDAWNKQPGAQQIRALILYRWPRLDRWFIDGKLGVVDDFRQALAHDYRWRDSSQPADARGADVRPSGIDTTPTLAPYHVDWLDDRFPARLMAGQTVSVPITVQNGGSLPWSWGGGNPFRIGYHFYRNRRLLELDPEQDLRTDIPQDVAPGDSVTVQTRIALPDQPGNYTVELDLVHEGVTWFKEQKSPVLTRWLTVEAPSDSLPAQEGGAGTSLVRLFTDVSGSLPRAGAYARRSLSQIRYLVISHTAANPRISLEHIARAHVRQGYPGIAYAFIVDSAGQVFRVTEIEDVAQPDQVWSEQGVNICLLGNFGAHPPPLAQLDGTGRLCAWLAQNLGLPAEAIIGLGELTRTDSPGETFYTGPTWKDVISRQVRLHLAALSGGGGDSRIAELELQIQQLTADKVALSHELEDTGTERTKLRTFSQALQTEIAELHRQLEVQSQEQSDGRPRIQPVADQLPRDRQRYVPRPAESVRYIVVHHTGVGPGVSLDELARTHIPDWPGLLYDFVIGDDGAVFQTQPLDEVAETDQPYVRAAISIAFAGAFDTAIPTDAQLYAGARLIAWLMEGMPQLNLDSIQGLSEFIEHSSPGRQWLAGRRWKELLLVAVRRASGQIEPGQVEQELRVQLDEQERRLQQIQRTNQALQEQKLQVQAENQRLQAELEQRTQANASYIVPKPAVYKTVEQLPKHPTLRYDRRARSQITHIAVHHTATPPTITPARIAEMHINPDPTRGKDAWPGIGYHFFVHADGSIEQLNELETISYHVYNHNQHAVGVVFGGSFMNGRIPASAQLRSGAHLIAWLMQEINVPLARVWGHREFPDNATVCPGSEWTQGNRWRDLLFERIGQVQSGVGVKSIRHYMLFWQRPYPGPMARQDFVGAINYVTRFRPAVGFSVEDARNAEYVTIVGNEAGVSAASERMLGASGCKVERIAGRDEEETGRMFAEMTRLGRRFRTFEVDF